MDLNEPNIANSEILMLPDPDFRLDSVCIVTGAGSGIGRATAVALAKNALTTVGLDVDEVGGKKTQEMVQQFGGQMVFIKTDLTRDEEIAGAVEEAAGLGAVKYLANIAGIQHMDSLENFPMESYDRMQQTMLRAPFYLAKLCISRMKRNSGGRGVIGNMGSIHAHVCTLNKAAYNVMKFGLRGLSQSIAAEGEGKIRSFSVSTGFVRTSLTLEQVPVQAQQRSLSPEEIVRDVMMGRSRVKEMMTPIEVANLFVFGFSHYARYLIGADLLFDGGVVLTY